MLAKHTMQHNKLAVCQLLGCCMIMICTESRNRDCCHEKHMKEDMLSRSKLNSLAGFMLVSPWSARFNQKLSKRRRAKEKRVWKNEYY